MDSRNKSALAGRRLAVLSALFGFELRRLLAGRAFWALLLILAPLAGYGYIEAVRLFGEASRTALQFPEMARGMTPLDGILVPTLGAFYLGTTLLFPFVAIRALGQDRESGAAKLALQWPLWHVHIPGDDDVLRYFHFAHRMAAGNAACLSLLGAWWQLTGQHTIQRRLPQSALPGRLAGIFSGVAVGLLLMPAVKLAMQHGALGSADAPWAGTAALFNFALPSLLQWAAIALAALLMR